ncbi:MAG: hypothetical protein IKQ54_10550 [Oscillospiraceae bacterium]|nr:hypothetical protein [Oscillospiraceae bacterium]
MEYPGTYPRQGGNPPRRAGIRGPRLAALLLSLVMLVTGVLGVLLQVNAVERFPLSELASGFPGQDSGTEAPPVTENDNPAAEPADHSGEALAAYLEHLSRNREGIEGYYWQKGGSQYDAQSPEKTPKPVALLDCWGDETPELIYVAVDPTERYVYMSRLYILTWDGALRTLCDVAWDVLAGGGFYYDLFQVEGSKELYAYTSSGDESWYKTYLHFVPRGEGLECTRELGWTSSPSYENGEYNQVIQCWQGPINAQEEISEERYQQLRAALLDKLSAVVLCSQRGDEDLEAFLAGNPELGMTVSDALFSLLRQTAPAEGAAELDPDALPDSLIRFLTQFVSWYRSEDPYCAYDAESAGTDGTNLLNSIVNNGSCVRFSIYPGQGQTDYWGENDPRGWSAGQGNLGSYAAYDAESVDWIARNIFHLSPAALLAQIAQGEEAHLFYRQKAEDGREYYYRPIGGVGDPFLKLVPSAASLEKGRYTVVYDLYFDTDFSSRYPSSNAEYEYSACAVLGWEEIDGSFYWTLYKNGGELPPEPEPEPAPELFSQIPARYLFASGFGGWGTQLVLNEDGSFRGRFTDANMGEGGEGYDGTLYYCNFTGRFTNPRKLNAYTWSFELESLEARETPGDTYITDPGYGRTRMVAAEPYGLQGGRTFYYYAEGAPCHRLPESFLGWVYSVSGRNSARLSSAGLYNEEGGYGFAATGGARLRFADWNEAFRDFVLNERFLSDGDLELGYGSLNYNDDPPRFALRDMDGDGQPELLVFNGQSLPDYQAIYVFRFQNGCVRYERSASLEELWTEHADSMSLQELRDRGWERLQALWLGGAGGAVRTLSAELGGETLSLDWGWDLFKQAPADYQPDLAMAAAWLCEDQAHASALLKTLGFEEVESLSAGQFTATMGMRLLRWEEEDRLIFALVLSEGPAGEEQLALLPDAAQYADEMAELFRSRLGSYLDARAAAYDFDRFHSSFFLCGAGLGGAAIGRLVPILQEELAEPETVFAYSFCTPRYLRKPGHAEKLPGIHNLLNSADLLTELPLGLGRSGKDHFLAGTVRGRFLDHSLAALRELLIQKAPEAASETGFYQRVLLTEPGTLRVLDESGRLLAEVRDGKLRYSSDAALVVLPTEEGCVVCADESLSFNLVMTGGAESGMVRQRVNRINGQSAELSKCQSLRLGKGAAWCVPVKPGAQLKTAVFELDEGGRALRRIGTDGSSERALFGSNVLGFCFLGLALLGLLGLILSLTLRR